MWYPAATARWLVPSLALALGAGAAAAPAVAADSVVTDVRVGQHGETTRLVFDLTRPVAFTVFSLADPYRVVLDLPEVGWRLPARALPGGVGLLKRLRYGLFKSGTSRVVLDVSGPAAIDKAFLLTPSGARAYRLVLDLAKTTRRAFLRQSKGPGVRVRTAQAAPSKVCL